MDVREKAVSYLNSRPRTRQELIRHLKDKGFSENEGLETVDELEQYHYIDDLAYSRMYFRVWLSERQRQDADPAGAGRRRRGCRCDRDRIRRTGRDPGTNSRRHIPLRRGMVSGIDAKELEFAEKRKLEGKIGRRLAGRGFSMDTIHKVVSRILY